MERLIALKVLLAGFRRYRRLALLLIWIGVGVGMLIFAGRVDLSGSVDGGVGSGVVELSDVSSEMDTNRVVGFDFVQRDPGNDYRESFRLSFGEMSVENGELGVFRSAMHKVVTFRDLKLRVFGYSNGVAAADGNAGVKGGAVLAGMLFGDGGELGSDKDIISGVLGSFFGGKDSKIRGLDVSNTSEVFVRGFECEFVKDGELSVRISSKRASLSYREPRSVMLRGHATVKTGDGTTLESNGVEWCVGDQCFVVRGHYVLTRNGEKISGRGICLDRRLEPMKLRNANNNIGENRLCSVNY